MKVLEQNTVVKEVTCGGCKSKLGIEISDIRYDYRRDYTGDGDDHFSATCAVCGAEIGLSLPYPLRDAVKRRSGK
jgi:hypothetical protein